MSGNDKRKALGRGLSALIPGAQAPSALPTPLRRDYFECAIEDIHPSEDNPRKLFDRERLRELGESIRAQGVVQPLVVRRRADAEGGGFTLSPASGAGEPRSWPACSRCRWW